MYFVFVCTFVHDSSAEYPMTDNRQAARVPRSELADDTAFRLPVSGSALCRSRPQRHAVTAVTGRTYHILILFGIRRISV